MNHIRKMLAIILALVMLMVLLPMSTMADAFNEIRVMGNMDRMWEIMDEAEGQSIQTYGQKNAAKTVQQMLEAARKNPYVDQSSYADIDDNGFSFKTIDGLACAYDYRIRTAIDSNNSQNVIETIDYSKRAQTSTSTNVLLIGPYYGSDSSFTDQYRNEAQSLAALTSGTYTLLSGSQATATAICENFNDKAVIIFDSHGGSYNSTSYLCLTTSVGISSSDYSDNSAINGGSWYGIDGTFIANHMSGSISASIVWMAICEGMMTDGLCRPLRAAGAEVVYGYSQSVSFTGDYKYEEAFYDHMADGYDVAASAAYMKSQFNNYDIYTSPNAYPIFVSDQDTYPVNPDSVQTVHSDWMLPLGDTFISPTSMSLQIDSSGQLNVTNTGSISISTIGYTPTSYSWASTDTSVAAITREKDKTVTITAYSEGTTNVTCRVYNGTEYQDLSCLVKVKDVAGVFVLTNVIEAGEEYLIAATLGNNTYLLSSNVYSTTISSSGYDYIYGTLATVSTIGSYNGTSDTTECIYMLSNNSPIGDDVRWTFSQVPTASAYTNITNVESGYNLSRYGSGNYTDLYPDTASSTAVCQRWYYNSNGLCAKSSASGTLAYITLCSATTPYFSVGGSAGNADATAASVKLYKKVTEITSYYSITFDDGENGTASATSSTIVAGNSLGALPTVTPNEGWSFDGWYTLANGGTQISASTIPAGNTTYYAHYSAIPTYTITFNAGDNGSCTETTRTIYAGQAIGELPEVTANEGWDFDGWYCNGTAVTAATVPADSMELVAQYTAWTTYTITFNAGDNGSVTETTRTIYAGQAIGELPEVTAEYGWTFDGWFNADAQVTADSIPSSDVNLTAKYTQMENYTVTFVIGTAMQTIDTVYVGTTMNELEAPAVVPASGYRFVGWAINGVVVPQNYVITEQTTFVAQFEIEGNSQSPAMVEFDANSGNVDVSSWTQTEVGDELVLPTPTKDGYTLYGWFDGECYFAAGASYLPKGNVELVAIWTPNGECEHSFGGGSCTICGTRHAGDANCDDEISAADAAAILRMIVKIDTLSTRGTLNANVDANSEITAADAASILRYIVHIIDSLG